MSEMALRGPSDKTADALPAQSSAALADSTVDDQQQQAVASTAVEAASVDGAAAKAGAVTSQPEKARPAQQSARPANWAGLLKSPKHAQRGRNRDSRPVSAPSKSHARAADHSDDYPDLAAALGLPLDSPMPSQLSLTESQGPFGNVPSQGVSQSPSESELQSAVSSPVGSTAPAFVSNQQSLAKDASWGSSSDSAVGISQESESQMAQQLQANASIWGSGLSTGGLTGIAPVLQLPQQQPQQLQAKLPQQQGSSYDSPASVASSVPFSTPWDQPASVTQISRPQPQPQSAAAKVAPVVKSLLVPNAQPFVPQSRQASSKSGSQQAQHAQQARFPHSQAQQQPRAGLSLSQQQSAVTSSLNSSSSVFLPGSLYSLQQQHPQSAAPAQYLNGSALGGYGSMLMPQQSHGLHAALSASLLDSGLQQLQRARLPPNAARQHQLQQQQQQQQQQLSDIWQQPAIGLQQNGHGRSTGFFNASQPHPPSASGQSSTGSLGSARNQNTFGSGADAGAFAQQPVQRQSASQQRGLQQGRFAGGHGNASAGVSGNGLANGLNEHLQSNGAQSEEDELLSGVFNKVWEDNLQVG